MPNTNRELKNKTNREYYQRNKKRILAKFKKTSKQIYAKNKEVIKKKQKEWRSAHYEKSLWYNLKSRCEAQKIEFNLEFEDIIIPAICSYLKVPLTRIHGKGRVWTNASIDRIDPSKGYTKGNIQIISMKANTMKNNASSEELIQFAESVLKINEILH